jgi:hypothetical protein
MNKEIIKDELLWLLEAINEQFGVIRHYSDKTPQMEFDILMENVRKMYESMQLLQQAAGGQVDMRTGGQEDGRTGGRVDGLTGGQVDMRTGGQVDGWTGGQADRRTGGRVDGRTGGQAEEELPVVTIRFDRPAGFEEKVEPLQVLPEPKLQQESGAPASEIPFKPIARASKTEPPQRKVQKSADMDLFADEEPAFSIKLKAAREKTFGPKIPSERIDNLKTAITINDKFMFINELFEGNLREYNTTIETLNGFSNLSQAGEFLDLVKRKNFWDTGSNAFKKLKELVEKRF